MTGYDAAYYEKTYGTGGLRRFGSHWWAVRYYALLARRLLRRTGGRRVLELGCGHGHLLARLAPHAETHGLELSDYAVAQCARFAPGATIHRGDLEAGLPADLAAGGFDLIVAKYLFEHLAEPGRALARTAEALRPGGVLLFSVPNLAGWGARRRGEAWFARRDPTHKSLLPPEEWTALTKEAGLALRELRSDGFWDLPYVAWLPRFLQWPLLLPTALACLTGWCPLPARLGENLIVVAEKGNP